MELASTSDNNNTDVRPQQHHNTHHNTHNLAITMARSTRSRRRTVRLVLLCCAYLSLSTRAFTWMPGRCVLATTNKLSGSSSSSSSSLPSDNTANVAPASAEDNDDFQNVTTMRNDSHRVRRTISLKNKGASVMSRCLTINSDFCITVWEWEKPAAVVETYWQVEQQGLCFTRRRLQKILDPFGLVTWPGSVIAVLELLRYPDLLRDKRVLVLGAGVGVEAQAAAMLGAAHVLATDIHPTTLRLLQFGAEQAGRNTTIDTQLLDIFSKTPLPECDVMIVADVLYNDQLAVGVAKRCIEARTRHGAVVVVSDSQRFVNNFEADLNQQLRALNQSRVSWVTRWLPQFTGSGVCIDGDQTYDVKARVLWIGLDTKLVSSGSMATMKP